MAALAGIETPRMDWGAPDLPTAFATFKQYANLLWVLLTRKNQMLSRNASKHISNSKRTSGLRGSICSKSNRSYWICRWRYCTTQTAGWEVQAHKSKRNGGQIDWTVYFRHDPPEGPGDPPRQGRHTNVGHSQWHCPKSRGYTSEYAAVLAMTRKHKKWL